MKNKYNYYTRTYFIVEVLFINPNFKTDNEWRQASNNPWATIELANKEKVKFEKLNLKEEVKCMYRLAKQEVTTTNTPI